MATKDDLVQVSSLIERFPDLTPVTPSDLADDLVERILLINHGRPGNDEPIGKDGLFLSREEGGQSINEKIENAWLELTGEEFPDFDIDVRPMHLLGAPSQAKSTGIMAASKRVAELCGMNFISKPNSSYVPNKNDLVFSSVSLAGHSSAMTVGGMPSKGEMMINGEKTPYMEIIPTMDYLAVAKSGMGVILLDEIGSAMPNIKPALNEIFDVHGKSGSLDLSYVMRVGASNLGGGVDGAMTTKNPSTLGTRCDEFLQILEMQDWKNNFVRKKYTSEAGDMGIIGFLDKNEHLFNCLPRSEDHSRPPAPRGWEGMMDFMLRKYATGKLKSQKFYMDIIEGKVTDAELKTVEAPHEMILKEARGRVGGIAADALASYMHSLWKGAQPIAEALINNKMSDNLEKLFDKQYGTGMSNGGLDFVHQFVRALPNETIASVKRDTRKGESLESAMDLYVTRFAKALTRLNGDDAAISLSIEEFRVDVASRIPEVRQVKTLNNNAADGRKVTLKQNTISSEWTERMFKSMHKVFVAEQRPEMSDIARDMITGHGTYNKASNVVGFN